MSIPLAQIPNAPRTGLTQTSTFRGGMTPFNPNAGPRADLGTAAAALGSVDNLLAQDGQPVEAFGAATAQALANLGESGQRAAGVLADWNLSMQRANDEANIARADRLVFEARAAHEVEASRLPPDQHLALWNDKFLPKLDAQIGELPLSNVGRARVSAWYESAKTQTTANIWTGANKAIIDNGRMEVQSFVQRAVNNAEWENAMGGIARGVASRLFSPEEGEAMKVKIYEEQKVNTMTAAIAANPAEWRKTLAAYEQDGGKNPSGLRPEQVIQFRNMAESKHSRLVGDLANEMLDRLETQSPAITNEAIEGFFTRPDVDAPRELINSIKKYRGLAYESTPEGQGAKAQKFSDLWQKIFSYDAQADQRPKDPGQHMQGYFGLLNEVTATAPEGERKQFLDALNKRVNDAEKGVTDRADQITQGLIDSASKITEWEGFGAIEWKKVKVGDTEKTVPANPEQYLKVQQKRMEVTNRVRALMRENPDLTEEQAMERFKGILQPHLDGGSLFMKEPEAESWWQKLMSFIPEENTGGRASEDVTGAVGGGRAPAMSLMDWMKKEEGFIPNAYADSGQTSVGYGTRGKPGEKLTEPEAAARLAEELAMHERRVDEAAARHGVALTTSMREALVSFDFNTGAVDKVLARKDPKAIADAMLLYKHADAKAKDASLTKRREREVAVFWHDGADEPLPPVNS
jgi:GH24 family phage-related lysozyme (muramidase)